jgi:hypothetical protein
MELITQKKLGKGGPFLLKTHHTKKLHFHLKFFVLCVELIFYVVVSTTNVKFILISHTHTLTHSHTHTHIHINASR